MCVRVFVCVCAGVGLCVCVEGREKDTLERPEREEASLPSGGERASRQTRFKHLRGGGGGSQAEDETQSAGVFFLLLLLK